jgi:pilus assembly protein CpaF
MSVEHVSRYATQVPHSARTGSHLAPVTPAGRRPASGDRSGTPRAGADGEPGASPTGPLARLAEAVGDDNGGGAGPLAALLVEPGVTDVLVNGAEVWVDRGNGLQRTHVRLGGPGDVRRLAQRLAAAGGRRLDDSCPFADVRLPDGTRLHAVLPPVARGGPFLSLRTLRRRAYSLAELIPAGSIDPTGAALLRAIVAARLAYVVTGGTGSGKTTLLSALLSAVPAQERIVIVEDAAELQPTHPHVVALEARVPNVEGAGTVSLRDLVRQALRMRPDRLVVGECRGAEIVDLLAALNTGHEGGAGTLHANTSADVPARLEALGLLGGVPREALHAQISAALQLVIHLRRRGAVRVVEEICVLLSEGGHGRVSAVPAWRTAAGPGPAAAVLARLLADRAVTPPVDLGDPAGPVDQRRQRSGGQRSGAR